MMGEKECSLMHATFAIKMMMGGGDNTTMTATMQDSDHRLGWMDAQ
jgi:hypothetical protein